MENLINTDEQLHLKQYRMTHEPVKKLVCKLAVPTIISMLITTIYNMADAFFVGMLNNTSATGAVGVVFSLMSIIQAIGFFFGHGSGIFLSNWAAIRKKKPPKWLLRALFAHLLQVLLLRC